jgi:hypothetical protein
MLLPIVLKELIEEYVESIIIAPHPTALMFQEIIWKEWRWWYNSRIPIVHPPYKRHTTFWCGVCGNPTRSTAIYNSNFYCACHD